MAALIKTQVSNLEEHWVFFYFIGIIIKDINVATLNKNEKMFGLKVVGWMDGQMKIYD